MATLNDLLPSIKKYIETPPTLPSTNPTIAAWQEPPHPSVATAQSAVLPSEADIVIIGSGICGTSAASTLCSHPAASGLRIVMLEARNACSGATGRNGGHLVSDTPLEFKGLIERLGLDAAKDVFRFSEANILQLRKVIEALPETDREKVEYRTVDSLAGFANQEVLDHAMESTELLEKHCPSEVLQHKFLSKEEAVKTYNYDNIVGAAAQVGAGALWPYHLITAILASLLEEHKGRFSLETNTAVTDLTYDTTVSDEATGYPYLLTTSRGTLKAKKVLHCTNGYSAHLLPNLVGKLHPLRGTMSRQTMSSEFPRVGDKWSFSHYSRGGYNPETGLLTVGLYYAQQNAVTGDLFIGGESQPIAEILNSDDSVVSEAARESLISFTPTMFLKGGKSVEQQVWSGIMGFTSDGFPLVGGIPESMSGRPGNGEWISAGFCGHGMDKCWLSADAMARMAIGDDNFTLPKPYLLDPERYVKLNSEQTVQGFLGVFA
ncbi:FAD dependent oxidoreductase [Xylariales sp. PMI_506]|nr:FAD dependent oxidoreductase [Xylariales sp. PMI_506]